MTRVLVVDDEIDTLNLLRVILEISGYEVFTTLNSVEAITLAEVEHPDCVLLDIMMPQLDGFTLCRMMRLHPATMNLPIVFVTAYSALDLEERRLEAGADMVLPKPVGMDVLIEAVESASAIRASRTAESKLVDNLSDIWVQPAALATDESKPQPTGGSPAPVHVFTAAESAPQPDGNTPTPAPVPSADNKPQPGGKSPASVPVFITADDKPRPDGSSSALVPVPSADNKPQPGGSSPAPVPVFTTEESAPQPADGNNPAPVTVPTPIQKAPDLPAAPKTPKPKPAK